MLSYKPTVSLSKLALFRLVFMHVNAFDVFVFSKVNRFWILEEVADELFDLPVFNDSLVIREVIEDLFELRVIGKSFDVLTHNSDKVMIQHSNNESEHKEDPNYEYWN